MEFQEQVTSDWSRCAYNQPPVEFDTNACHHLLSSDEQLEDNADSFWTNTGPGRVMTCSSGSFAMDARLRLDHLKSGSTLGPLPFYAMDAMLYNYTCQKDRRDRESQEKQSVLDSVELLEVEDDVEDEESWLYESPKKHASVDNESALGWCRHVLDNPSPQVEAACRLLMSKLEQRSSSSGSRRFYRCPAAFHQTDMASGDSPLRQTPINTTHGTSDSLGLALKTCVDNTELSGSHDSMTTSYRLQDITDVHIMARLQEASLRQDYVSMPASASLIGGPESPPCPSFRRQTPALADEQSCASPRLARLNQQVTQFKLLKRAQNQATSPGRTRSPLRTSLRSLQAVRNSRSLENDDCHLADRGTSPPSGASAARTGLGCWSPSLSAAPASPNGPFQPARDSWVQPAVMKRLQRSQSLSPCRIPHPARTRLAAHGRVFASPERSAAAAWGRNAPPPARR